MSNKRDFRRGSGGKEVGTAQTQLQLMEAFLDRADEAQIEEAIAWMEEGEHRMAFLLMHRVTDFNLPTKPKPAIPLTEDELLTIKELLEGYEPNGTLYHKVYIAHAIVKGI